MTDARADPTEDGRASILAADDHAANLTALIAVLGPIDREVVTAGSGAEALRLLASRDFAVAVLDVKMPDLSGLEVARRVRSSGRNAAVPIIFLTALDGDTAAILDGYAAGAVDYLRKPFEPAILRSKVAIFVELHERREQARREAAARAELEMQRAAAARESREKDEFLSVLSHELRTPLTSILLWSEMLLRRDLGADAVRRGHQIIDRCARIESRMVENVLEMSRLATGRFALDLQPTELVPVVRAAIDDVRELHQSAPVALAVRVAEGLLVPADRARLSQLLFNLLDNAVKFTGGSDGGAVGVTVEGEGGSACVRVADSGPGISADVRAQLFRPFRAGDASHTRPHAGLGLGLAVAHAVAVAHGGTLVVGDHGGGAPGTVVTLTIPRDRDS